MLAESLIDTILQQTSSRIESGEAVSAQVDEALKITEYRGLVESTTGGAF